ncbi:MAG: class I SAM-dependent methyltransferase [Sphingobacteriales bacterium]|nr:class I SAM-dependent methyltransferase [Sphingobacteriales bacterium]
MNEEKFLMFRNRLTKVFRHLSKQAKRQAVSCYRLYDHDLPEFPFCIELYGDKIYVAEYKRQHGMTEHEHNVWMEESLRVISEVLSINKKNIFLKLRQRKPGRLGQYQKLNKSENEFQVEEAGLNFIVNLSDYLDTGLFLDHRITRQMVREQSAGKKVLNLFAYTGSFSVYAAAGLSAGATARAEGADEVITVDLSKTYLNWAQRNMQLNGFTDDSKYRFVQADVLQYIKTLPVEYFDIIVLDPPTFSNSQRMKDFLDIQQDHVALINDCLAGLKKGGTLYFSTNYRKFILDNDKIKAARIKDITKATTPFDFEGRLSRVCFVIKK